MHPNLNIETTIIDRETNETQMRQGLTLPQSFPETMWVIEGRLP